jgi:membrane protease YdiL (CAAX protease family)
VSRRRRHAAVSTAVLLELSLAAVALVLGAIAGISPLRSLEWRLDDVALGCFAAVPLLAVFRIGWRSRAAALRRIREALERLLPEMFAGTSTVGLTAVSLAAGIGEEILFRGFLQGWLETILGPHGGLIAASLLFGAAHPITPGYAAIATLMGAYLGALWLATGNLLVPIVTHAVYDLIVLRVLLRGAAGQ